MMCLKLESPTNSYSWELSNRSTHFTDFAGEEIVTAKVASLQPRSELVVRKRSQIQILKYVQSQHLFYHIRMTCAPYSMMFHQHLNRSRNYLTKRVRNLGPRIHVRSVV